MFLSVVFITVLTADACFKGINEGLPSYIMPQSFGIIDVLYRLLRIIAPSFLLFSLTILRLNLGSIIIGGVLYFIAYCIKQAAWSVSYGIK